jgi:hypothetical protein
MNSRKLSSLTLPMFLVVACAFHSVPARAQMTSVGIDCSQIQALNLLKQDNMRAGKALIECGVETGGQPANGFSKPAAPPNVRASNRACTSSTSCTKSESNVWASTKDSGQTIVVNYNDSNGQGSSYTGTSYSSDGGATFTEITPPPFQTGQGTNYGDPIVVFNSKQNLFFAGDLVTACGGFGIGLWTSADGKTWKTGACAHNGGSDDRESMWVDNEPTSGTYGRMYVSFNDFTNNGGALSLMYSDDGKTWTGPVILNGGFIRDVQVTGTPAGTTRFEGKNSTVFVAAMDEGGGGNATRQNLMYKSLDGGKTWTSATLGPRFSPVGDQGCSSNSYFWQVNPIWRHMGWGEPAVGPAGVVHYDYAGAGTKGDDGDIYYVRSADNGKTWSKPIKLNTDKDAPHKTQWMPSLSADLNGNITAAWYDRRKSKGTCTNVTDPGCKYERVGRQSTDNGATWGKDITISTAVIPEPAQDDPTVVGCYAGDYDYNTALNGNAFVTWTDGRRKVSGTNVQDVDFAKVPEPAK